MNLERVLERNFLDYAAFVAQRRAVPDARDMLKYTARQILHAQMREKLDYKHAFKKSQKSVAAATSFSYCHGDASAYSQIIHMGRPLVQRYLLEEIVGNSGTPIQSNGYAASRYTEARTSELASKMFEFIDHKVLNSEDWAPTYDEEGIFPLVLPACGFSNIVNGSFGSIGVGLISSVPQFNLREINKAFCDLIDNPNAEIKVLPDFASGGILLNPETTWESLKKGEGKSALLRGEIREKADYLEIYSLPYGVYTNTVCGEIEKAMEEGSCPITDIKDVSKQSVSIRVWGKDFNLIKKWLYKNTSVQKHFTIKLIMLDEGTTPKLFSLKGALLAHLKHSSTVLRRHFEFQIDRLAARAEVIKGLLKAHSIIDTVIRVIKSSNGRADAISKLESSQGFTNLQAQAIVDLRLHRLSAIDIQSLEQELRENEEETEKISKILKSSELFNLELKARYEEISSKFGDDRRTKININAKYESGQDGSKPKENVGLKYNYEGYSLVPAIEIYGTKSEKDFNLHSLSPNTELIIITNEFRAFLRKVEDFTLGNQEWRETIALREGEGVVGILNPDLDLRGEEQVIFELEDGELLPLHKSYVTLSASRRGKKITNHKKSLKAIAGVE